MSRKLSALFHRLLHREEGQAGFEFLLMLPVFFLFFLMLIDFGVTMYDFVSVSNAVREGARYGAVNCGTGTCTAAEIQQWVVDRSGGVLSSTGDVTVSWPDGGDRGDSVVVKVSHPHSFIFFPYTWTVTSCANMRLEQQDAGVSGPSGSGCT